ncbi:hypothetical protein [Nonomuraea ferruginea]|uniref:Phosphodiesterase n=1 Tax=Nonomuraea ferruginea TaxID=46174 RepID=A0ABT4T3I6_9ACTN|nr:hypothetical protein [Nonomuraea ferruginea]MDA0643586.1 hypothetical protein [Nonomuraea ferruginea]
MRRLATLGARLRRGRVLHPRGRLLAGTLEVTGAGGLGVPVLDERGQYEVIARLSKGGSLPGRLPDVLGLAVRLPGPVDLLLSTCGAAPWLLRPRAGFTAGPYSSVVPYGSDAGPVWLVAVPEGEDVPADPALLPAALRRGPLLFHLLAARRDTPARPLATLRVRATLSERADLSFDPVRHGHPSLRIEGSLARLRRGAYQGSREGRHAEL